MPPLFRSLALAGLLLAGLTALPARSVAANLVENGDFETDANADNWPDNWNNQKANGAYETDAAGNRFVRLQATEPGKLVMLLRTIPVPAGEKALKLAWRWRVSDLKIGKQPWFDARFVVEFRDAGGEKLSPQPNPSYSRGTKDWESRTTEFLIPEGAATLTLMPALFQVTRGVIEIDDITLVPTDTAALEAAAKLRAEEAAFRYVAPETDNRSAWPAEIRVQGNRLVTVDGGREVWLQGLNAGGLETLPQDMQVLKSVVVGIDDWKSNAIRLPMNERFWFGRDPGQKDGGKAYREKIDQIITLTANRGAYLVIDLHRFRAPKAEHVEFWKDAATRYKNHPAVLFDLFNEPHGISWKIWRDGGFVGEKTGADESAFLSEEEKKKNQGFESPGMQALVDAVRSTGARNIVIAGGLGWAGDLSGVVNGYALEEREGGNGIMYSWHQYNWHKGWDKTVLPVAALHPVFVGEVGADTNKMNFIPHDIQESPYTWVPDMLGFIQKHRLNWTAWCFHPRATPVMISDWKYTPTPFWGVFAKEALAGKQFEMRRMR
ncbi:MAG: glycoside hydrolase family 5 [Rariglobus sp.]|jgi:hypothetical protein|nr:glycoside hydrolase family 5 [Rariglobus sp.]